LIERLFTQSWLQVSAQDGMGLTPGDRVVMQGIQIGEVSRLDFWQKNRVLIACKIYPQYRAMLTQGIRVQLVAPPVIGNPLVRIEPGAGDPLAPTVVVEAQAEDSLLDGLKTLPEDLRRTIAHLETRMVQVGGNLAAFQEILEAVKAEQGLVGALIYGEELHRQVGHILQRVDQSMDRLETIRIRTEEFSTILPKLKHDMQTASKKLNSSLTHLEKSLRAVDARLPAVTDDIAASSKKLLSSLTHIEEGLENFPEISKETFLVLEDARKIMESAKRNVLIRGNLPADLPAESMTPASLRDPVTPSLP
jgi:ABC-type transporter Mla subunit MlaD